jgi:hypothetical protein
MDEAAFGDDSTQMYGTARLTIGLDVGVPRKLMVS